MEIVYLTEHRGPASYRNPEYGLANAVRHEPRRLVRHAKIAMQLVGGIALLAGIQQMHGQQPFMEGDFAILE